MSQAGAGSCARSPAWLPEHRGRGGQLALMELILVSHCSARLAGWRDHQKNKAGWGVGTFSNVQPTLFPSFHGTFSCISKKQRGVTLLLNATSFYLFLRVVSEGWQLTSLLSQMPAAFFVGHLRHNL